jgi:prevent-host-death family protein
VDARASTVSLADAKARLSELIARAQAGEEIVVTRHGEPVARIVPVRPPKQAIPSMAAFRATMTRMRTPSAKLIRQLRDEESDR